MQIGRSARSSLRRRALLSIAVLVACPLALSGCARGSPSSVPQPTQLAQPTPTTTPQPAACPSAEAVIGGGRAGMRFHSRRGACIPRTRLLAYRCSDSLPPVIVRDAGGAAHTYLGGRFGVAIRTLPPNATLLGRSGAIRVFGVPGDPSWLFVREGGVISRWLPLPTAPPTAPPHAFFLGDSIMLGAESAVTQSLPAWQTSFDAVIGRPSSAGVSVAEVLAASPDPPDVVVVELGTNDIDPAAFRANAVRILSTLRHVPLVVWQTAHGPMPTIEDIDRVIRQVAPRSSNTAVADWNAFVPADALQPDGIHPLPDRVDEVAKLLHPFLTDWLDASEGGGATGCGSNAGASTG